jgi:hypothetical protein
MCPRLVVAKIAGKPKPPKKLGAGVAGGALGYFIPILPSTTAKTLQPSMIPPTTGLHSKGVMDIFVAATKSAVNMIFTSLISVDILFNYQKNSIIS